VAALALRDYSTERYAESAYGETIDHLTGEPEGGVIFTDQSLYQQMYAFLVRKHGLYLVEANEALPGVLRDLAARHRTLHVLYAGSEDDERSNPEVEGWLNRNAFPVGVQWLGNTRLTTYSTPTSGLRDQPLQATFAGQMELSACAFDPGPHAPSDILRVSLSWRSLYPTETDYTIFVHLVDQDERVWAQHDSPPVGGSRPTSSWQPGEEILDNHGLALPRDIPPGEYRLAVGLYDPATGERLIAVTAGEALPTDRVLVGPVLFTGGES
jgi:hypothetical protein